MQRHQQVMRDVKVQPMLLPSAIRRSRLVALAMIMCLATAGFSLPVQDASAQERRPNCENFLNQGDAQATFLADLSDPFDLDRDGNGEACEDEELFGTAAPVNCNDLRDHPDAGPALQGLYDYTQSQGAGDPYNLDPDGNGVACDGDGGGDTEPLDGVPPDTRGTTVVVIAGALGTGETLEARLEARFAALEAQFVAFEARAENGFGMFPDSGDDAPAGGQATSVIVSASQQPITMTQRTADNNAGNPTTLAQRASDAKDETRVEAAQKVRKDVKRERAKAHKGKRDRHQEKKRNRR